MNGQMEKEKQIEEMESVIFESSPVPSLWHSDAHKMAETLYNAGYRKERQGEWEQHGLSNPKCSLCGKYNIEKSNYCPNCGCKIIYKGER